MFSKALMVLGFILYSGAYCGAFISNSTDKPFLGVTYKVFYHHPFPELESHHLCWKGTDNFREMVTHIQWDPELGLSPGCAFGARIHHGFNEGLFGNFGDDDLILQFALIIS